MTCVSFLMINYLYLHEHGTISKIDHDWPLCHLPLIESARLFHNKYMESGQYFVFLDSNRDVFGFAGSNLDNLPNLATLLMILSIFPLWFHLYEIDSYVYFVLRPDLVLPLVCICHCIHLYRSMAFHTKGKDVGNACSVVAPK